MAEPKRRYLVPGYSIMANGHMEPPPNTHKQTLACENITFQQFLFGSTL